MHETDASTPANPGERAARERPTHVPDKFWDGPTGTVRVDALLKSYLELERRLGTRAPDDADMSEEQRQRLLDLLGRPSRAEEYEIAPPHGLIEPDADLNRRLHEAGFSQTQAQLVYELAVEKLLPVIGEMIGEADARRQLERLERHFGGPDAWRETARQIATWASANLEPEVHHTLAGSFDGVVALHQLMRASEPKLLDADGNAVADLNEGSLREMMRDPRYWRDRDPDFVGRVTAGFRRLYPS